MASSTTSSIQPFLKGLAVATLGGALTSIGDAQTHRHLTSDPAHVGSVAAIGAATGLLTFLIGHMNGQQQERKDAVVREETGKGVDSPGDGESRDGDEKGGNHAA